MFKVGDCVTDWRITGRVVQVWSDGDYSVKTQKGDIFIRSEKELVAAYKYYCGKCIEGEKTMETKQYTAQELAAEAQARNQADSVSRPKFKVGDRVKFGFGNMGTIKEVHTHHTYTIEAPQTLSTGAPLVLYTRDELYLVDAPLTPEEAWDKAAILVGKRESAWNHSYMTTRAMFRGDENAINKARVDHDKETRHQVYVILGSAHIKIGENSGPVKTRVRSLIVQASKR